MAYHKFAYIYDQLMAHAPYDEWVNFTIKALQMYNKNVQTIVDLGCGTGMITRRLSKLDYQMTGVDNSADMLTYAEHKATSEKLTIQWLHQDLRELRGLKNLDMAISFCDVINYLTTQADVLKAFENVFTSLKIGGLFIFDVHSVAYVNNYLLNQTFADITDDSSYIWFCTEGEQEGELYHDLTFFVKENGSYDRFDEVHKQRVYEIEVYIQLLKQAGFTKIDYYSDFSLEKQKSNYETERFFFIAEK